MVRDILDLRTGSDGDIAALEWETGLPVLWDSGAPMLLERQDGVPFKGIELTEYSFKSPRMGMPTLTATLTWPTCLDDEWTGKEYVVLRGEKYYIRQAASSEISNDNIVKYKHSLEFKSEREQLAHTYFYDVVPAWAFTSDRPCSNSTTFKLYATIEEYVDRLNCAFRYSGIGDSILNIKTNLTDTDTPVGDGYCVVLSRHGGGDLTQSQEISFEDQWLWDAIVEGFNKFKIPFSFHGKKIIFNEYIAPISRVFKYGFDNELLSIKKNNANARIINRITFQGSSENIPHYYPNETEYGIPSLTMLSANSHLTASDFVINDPQRLVRIIPQDTEVVIKNTEDGVPASCNVEVYNGSSYEAINYNEWYLGGIIKSPSGNNDEYKYYRIVFTISKPGSCILRRISGENWGINGAEVKYPPHIDSITNIISSKDFEFISLGKTASQLFNNNVKITESRIEIRDIPAGTYYLEFKMHWAVLPQSYWMITAVDFYPMADGDFAWYVGEKYFSDASEFGLTVSKAITASMAGEGFKWTAGKPMPFQANLMPPLYRETRGEERFYNAENNTYPKEEGGFYSFKNPYTEGNPSEYIYKDDSIKPTIEGVKNAAGVLMGKILDIAFDSDDNDSFKDPAAYDSSESGVPDASEYAHSFFYIRLTKFDGPNGFDLFGCASQTDPMTIQMTSGPCNGCKFKIQVIDDKNLNDRLWRNPVQTIGPDGYIINGLQSDIIKENNPQEWQQDTTQHSIWIAVQKDTETFGVIMPNRSHKYMPEAGDTFNIINIDLPQGYVDAAEERGKKAMLYFMENNNEEKFNFDISFSRIFFANNHDILAALDENSRIQIEYNGRQYTQYVSDFSINCKNGEVLPEVKVSLADSLSPSGSLVEETVSKVSEMIGGQSGGATASLDAQIAFQDRRYLRKDMDDRSAHRIASDDAIEVGDFVAGSSGGILFVDPETGKSTLEVDYLRARMKAIFEALEIAHVRSIGGKFIITPGGSITISFVKDKGDRYRCYFKRQEENEAADCRFKIGDDVYCQSFNVSAGTLQNASNKFYWRRVMDVNNESSYIDISKNICAADSDAPAAGDVICQLGSTLADRRSAIVLSTVGTNAPCITLYSNVKSFTLSDKEMVDIGVDSQTGKAYLHVYGDAYIGDKEGASYIEYDNLQKEIIVKAKLTADSTVGDNVISDYISDIIAPDVEGMQNQIDGKAEVWYQSTDPSERWVNAAEKRKHEGDLWYNTSTKETKTYQRSGNLAVIEFLWEPIEDNTAILALQTANQKVRVFYNVPTVPYDIGDLLIREHNAQRTLWRSINARTTAYNVNDWVLATTYDNTKTTIDGGIITSGTVQLANGNSKSIVAGITGGESESASETEERKVRIWSGASKENRFTAPFRVLQDGSLYTSKAIIEGDVVYSGRIMPRKTVITSSNYKQYTQPYIVDGILISTALIPNISAISDCVTFDSSLNRLIANNTFTPACLMPSQYRTGDPFYVPDGMEIEDFIGCRVRFVNKTSYNFGVTGMCMDNKDGDGISADVRPNMEIYLSCFIRYMDNNKQVAWLIEYMGPQ